MECEIGIFVNCIVVVNVTEFAINSPFRFIFPIAPEYEKHHDRACDIQTDYVQPALRNKRVVFGFL